ncbi:MAG: YdcF family protein [Arenicellales bacterium]
MEIFLSKFIPMFVYPVGLAFCLLVIAALLMLTGKRRTAWVLVFAIVLLIFAAGNDYTSYKLIHGLESEYPPMKVEDTPKADVIVVLGGGLSLPLPPRLYPELNGSSDRLLRALRLYRAGKADHILLSGGNVFPEPGLESESYYARGVLELWGVPESAVVLETKSRNTLQNAEYSAPILRQRQWRKVLLVTSASHMHRAVMAFHRAGVNVIPVPVDYIAVKSSAPEALGWVPNVGALGGTTYAIHEYLGRLWYRLKP